MKSSSRKSYREARVTLKPRDGSLSLDQALRRYLMGSLMNI